MAIVFDIVPDGRDFSCSADGSPPFFVGRRVPYEGNVGLYNLFGGSKLEKLLYSAADHSAIHGFWATFIEPTAICEGLNFLSLNTYDSAMFTFGFGQFAAHVADGDFVKYLRSMLQLPNTAEYFPDLAVVDGRICRTDGDRPVPLETGETTQPLMTYLNPDLSEVQDAEVLAAARLIHWTSTHAAARDAQVGQMVSTYRAFMRRADRKVGIDGRSAHLCCVIADILHHGRGGRTTWPQVEAGLASARPFDALIDIGASRWDDRKAKLKAAINERADLFAKSWSRAQVDFV